MNHRPLGLATIACLAVSIPTWASGGGGDGPVASMAKPMMAVARLLAEDTWGAVLDDAVQQAAPAERGGTGWGPEDAAWKQARAALGARLSRTVDAYERSGDLARRLAGAYGNLSPSLDRKSLAAALDGPGGAAIVRHEALSAYVAQSMSASPGGPAPGQPEWMTRYRSLKERFDARIGTDVPPDDGAHTAEALAFLSSRSGAALGTLWTNVVGGAQTAIDGAMNLMLFDDRDAIAKDLANAVATSTSH